MNESYVFTGFGTALPRYRITNPDLEKWIDSGYITGFDSTRAAASTAYQEFLEANPFTTPFDYFVRVSMGFEERYFVAPFPPNSRVAPRQTSLELAVAAITDALEDADLHPEEVGAWIISTLTSPVQSPGLGTLVKKYFVSDSNQSAVSTLASGCAGFHLGIKQAYMLLEAERSINHVVVAHAETMSRLLTTNRNFLPFAILGDGAAAVVVSRVQTTNQAGILGAVIGQDPRLIDVTGANRDWAIYMDASSIKNIAIESMKRAVKAVFSACRLKIDDIDLLVPHQTGSRILLPFTHQLNLAPEKLYHQAQFAYGNISGATVPLALACLHRQGRLQARMTLLSPTFGVGGEYGAFVYRVPDPGCPAPRARRANHKILQGTTALVSGATEALGGAIADRLADLGANLILQYKSNRRKAEALRVRLERRGISVTLFKADLASEEDTGELIRQVGSDCPGIEFLILCPESPVFAAVTSGRQPNTVSRAHCSNLAELALGLGGLLKAAGVIIYVGSAAEETQLEKLGAYTAARKALRGFAGALAGEVLQDRGIKSIYYLPGLMSGETLPGGISAGHFLAMQALNQEELLSPAEVAARIVASLYRGKIAGTWDAYEGKLLVRRDGYQLD